MRRMSDFLPLQLRLRFGFCEDSAADLATVLQLECKETDVWKALTDAQELKKWFPLEARVTPGAGGKIFLSWGPGCEGEAEIVAWEPGKRLACKEQFALIEWTLEQRGTKTLLRLVQRGFLGAGDRENEWFDSTSYGWTFMLLSLEVALERHRGIDRKVAWPRVQVNLCMDARPGGQHSWTLESEAGIGAE
jgi:uncharacterized protein YndB with AHSA1/START domain